MKWFAVFASPVKSYFACFLQDIFGSAVSEKNIGLNMCVPFVGVS